MPPGGGTSGVGMVVDTVGSDRVGWPVRRDRPLISIIPGWRPRRLTRWRDIVSDALTPEEEDGTATVTALRAGSAAAGGHRLELLDDDTGSLVGEQVSGPLDDAHGRRGQAPPDRSREPIRR